MTTLSKPPKAGPIDSLAAGPREPTAYEVALASLQAAYAASLPGRLFELASAVAAAKRDGGRAAIAIHLAHRLRGSAGAYGFVRFGEKAGRIEDLLIALDAPLPKGQCESPVKRELVWLEIASLIAYSETLIGLPAQQVERSARPSDVPTQVIPDRKTR